MAPAKAPAPSQTPGSQRKQASISSFFTPKPSQASSAAKPVAKSVPEDQHADPESPPNRLNLDKFSAPLTTSNGKKRSPIQSSDAENQAPDTKRRRISKNAPKVLEDSDDDEETAPPVKPAKVTRENSAVKKSSAARTSKYIFSSSPAFETPEEVDDDEEARKYRERMHERFVRKLVKPDAISELRRRQSNGLLEEDGENEGNEGEDGEEDEPQPKKTARGAKKPAGGARANGKLTPMEQQYLEIKLQHLDTIIIYQVGYKYRIFGEDARIASKVLSFFLIPGKFRYDNDPSEAQWDRLASCSFPVVSLTTHVKRLVAAGHKVGVVKQLETAALKAVGDNRNTPFVRKLTNVYTKGTYVDDVEGTELPGANPINEALDTGYLICLTESNARGWGNDEKVHVGIVAVQPATGSIIFDDFDDGFMRSEIETRLLHIAPCEYLIVGELSSATNKLVKHLSGSRANVFGAQARLETIEKPKTMAAESYSHISTFYASKLQSEVDAAQDERQTHTLDKIHQLTEHVTICLSAMIKHLTEYGLDHIFDLTKNFQSFSTRTHMLLNGNTLSSLEIYRNQTDHTEKGSLFWSLDRTRTRFGKRLLRTWVGRPLLDKSELERRVDAVEDLTSRKALADVDRVNRIIDLAKCDLEKVLTRIYYKKAARPEVLLFLQTLQQISDVFSHVQSPEDVGFTSELLSGLVAALPPVGQVAIEFLDQINAQSAKDDDKYTFFRSDYETEDITNHMVSIAAVEHDLEEHRAVAAQKIGKKKVDYVTVLLTEYLIEVPNEKAQLQKVPASWIKVNGTKAKSRFHTPEVVKMIRERDRHKEAMAAACDDAYTDFLESISSNYQVLREAVQALATIDCLLSLAEVASQPGYVKPTYTQTPGVYVKGGRHPMVERLLLESYVPNDIQLRPPSEVKSSAADDPSALLITGPNMGGKSSYVRSVALIAIMAQIGSYVPADSAELGLLDAVFTRMGAFDNMMRGESTFMVELGETSDILKQATSRSLVILDELGRGTSTHDGVAIAEAVLREMISRGIMTLFITHYQDLAKLGGRLPGVENVHMRFQEDEVDGEKDITFLYEIGKGVAHRSYGLNVAKLAKLPKSILDLAVVKSKDLETSMEQRKLQNIFGALGNISIDDDHDINRFWAGLQQLGSQTVSE